MQKRGRVRLYRGVRLLAGIEYLSTQQLVEINKRILKEVKARKADSHRVANHAKLDAIIAEARATDGDVYTKAACLLTGLYEGDTPSTAETDGPPTPRQSCS